MPTFVHSKLSKFFLGLSGASPSGTVTDISTYCDEVGMPEELELVETTTFGSTSKQYITGFADGKITISGNWDTTIAGYLGDLYEAFRDGTILSTPFEYGPEGSDSGDFQYSGNVVLISYEKMSAVKDQVKFTAEFQITGPTTTGTFSA